MERVQPPRSADDSAPETVGPLPGMHPLFSLLTAARASGSLKKGLDALVRGMSRSLDEGETPRARADFLLYIIESPEVGNLQVDDRRILRAVAVQALLDLGYPYALEVPPSALAEAHGAQEKLSQSRFPFLGLFSALIALVASLSMVLAPYKEGYIPNVAALIIAGVLLGPTLLSLLGGTLRRRTLLDFGVTAMGFTSLLCLLPFSLWLFSPGTGRFNSFLGAILISGLGFLFGSILMRPTAWLGAEAEKNPEEKAPEEKAPER